MLILKMMKKNLRRKKLKNTLILNYAEMKIVLQKKLMNMMKNAEFVRDIIKTTV